MTYNHRFSKFFIGVCAAVALCAACEDDDRPIIPLPPLDPPASAGDKVIVLVEQNPSRVALVDRASGEMLWSWTPADSDLTAAEQAWFELPDEVKPIYDCEYLLVTATRGGVAIIRIEDKRVMFYACPKGQPHSAELLPDGNVVVASSTDGTADGDKLRLYEVDFTKRFASEPAAVYPLNFGHNAVWDRTNELLWATAGDVLHAYRYIRTDGRPALALQETYPLPDGQKDAHDLFPVHGLNQLWLTTPNAIWKFNVSTKEFARFNASATVNVKCVSSGPADYETILLYPTQSYWSDKLIDTGGRSVYQRDGAQIYKGRWMLANTFSYPENHRPEI